MTTQVVDYNNMSKAELIALAQNAKAAASTMLSMKVSQKGALSVYGLGRFPVTLYSSQWSKLLASKEDIVRFLADNVETLTVKA